MFAYQKFLLVLSCLLFTSCQNQNPEIQKTPSYSADIAPFLHKYFSSWSSKDINTYSSLFHESAVIMRVENNNISVAKLKRFIKQQEEYLSQANGPVSEKIVSFTVDEDATAIAATVKWLFNGEGREFTGVDRFSLIRDPAGKLRIISLVWYKD